jgi:nicotinamidase-related amidase
MIMPENQTAKGGAALLLVDLQEEHRKDRRYLAADYGAALANAAALLSAARAAHVPVFHAQYIRDFAVEGPRPFEVVGPKGEPSFSDPGSGLTDICPEVAPLGSETIITKQDASAFKGTDLGARLTAAGIEWLVVAGAWTEACVAATVRDCVAAGFRVLLVKDACASGTALMHQTAVLNLANRLLGGGVADTANAARFLKGEEARLWRHSAMAPFRFTAENVAALYAAL